MMTKLPVNKSAAGSAMMRSILFDVAFLEFGGALFISTINIQGALVSLVIGVLAALAHSATNEAPRARRFGMPVGLCAAVG